MPNTYFGLTCRNRCTTGPEDLNPLRRREFPAFQQSFFLIRRTPLHAADQQGAGGAVRSAKCRRGLGNLRFKRQHELIAPALKRLKILRSPFLIRLALRIRRQQMGSRERNRFAPFSHATHRHYI